MIGRFIVVLAAAGYMFAQPNTDKMMSSSVAVYGTVGQGDKREARNRAGGFVLDSRHVLTNLPMCCGKTDDGQQLEPVTILLGKKGASAAKVVWSSEGLLMAILELADPIDAPAVSFAPVKLSQSGQAVYTVQQPAPGDKDGKVTITDGKMQDTEKVGSGVLAYKTTANMIPGNAGGALFDACGNVMAMNLGLNDKFQFAVVIDPALEALPGIGVQASVADRACTGGGTTTSAKKGGSGGAKGGEKAGEKGAEPEAPTEWRLPKGGEWLGVILLIGLAALAFRRSTRQQVARALTSRRTAVPEPAPYPYPAGIPLSPSAAKPALRGIAGQYAGESVPLDAGPSTLGRDQQSANLVFPAGSDSISKRHCRIAWDAERRVFVLEDLGSTNGTFLASGERLTPGQPLDLRVGDRFYIGDMRNQFEVRMEE